MDDFRDQLNGYGTRLNRVEINVAGCQGRVESRLLDCEKDIVESRKVYTDIWSEINALKTKYHELELSMERIAIKIVKDVSIILGVVFVILSGLQMVLQPMVANLIK